MTMESDGVLFSDAEQLDGHARDAWFPGILDSIPIEVMPHEVADGRRG